MPELPFIQVLVENLVREVVGRTIISVRVPSPSIVKTFDPPISALTGRRIDQVTRQGKLIVFHLSDSLRLVLHLMRDGRLYLAPATQLRGRPSTPKPMALGLMLDDGRELRVNESGPKKRAAVYVLPIQLGDTVEPLAGLGPDPLSEAFTVEVLTDAVRAQPNQLKRAITLQRYVVGIGNAFEQHRTHFGSTLPTREPVTLLRVHRHGGEPCPRCQTRIETVFYAEKETYYCPHCQTKGKVYADRRLSRLLK